MEGCVGAETTHSATTPTRFCSGALPLQRTGRGCQSRAGGRLAAEHLGVPAICCSLSQPSFPASEALEPLSFEANVCVQRQSPREPRSGRPTVLVRCNALFAPESIVFFPLVETAVADMKGTREAVAHVAITLFVRRGQVFVCCSDLPPGKYHPQHIMIARSSFCPTLCSCLVGIRHAGVQHVSSSCVGCRWISVDLIAVVMLCVEVCLEAANRATAGPGQRQVGPRGASGARVRVLRRSVAKGDSALERAAEPWDAEAQVIGRAPGDVDRVEQRFILRAK